jgi:hypothetical protein
MPARYVRGWSSSNPAVTRGNSSSCLGWCVVIVGIGYFWSTAIYERKPVR